MKERRGSLSEDEIITHTHTCSHSDRSAQWNNHGRKMLFWNGLTGHYLNVIMNLSSPVNVSALQCLVCDGNFQRGDNLVPAWRAEIMQVMHDRRRLCARLVSTPSVHRSMTPITAVVFVKGKRDGVRVNLDLICFGSRALQNLLTPGCCVPTGEAGAARSELSCTQGFDSVLGFLHVWRTPSSSLLCLPSSKTQRPQTDRGSLFGPFISTKEEPIS